MIRNALRRWLLGSTAPAAELANPDRHPLDQEVGGRPGQGAARMRALLAEVKKAPVPRGNQSGGMVVAMDARDVSASAPDVFGALDPNAAMTDALLGWFGSQQFIGYWTAAVLAQHWLIDKACSMPARDAVRHGYAIDVQGLDGYTAEATAELVEKIQDLDKSFRVAYHLQDFVRSGRIFGVRLCLFTVDLGSEDANREYYENPFNPDAVKPNSYRGMRQVDQYWCGPLLDEASASDPLSPAFYEPTWWMIGGRKIHRSHFAIFRATEVPDNLKPYYLYGGVPLPQRIMERVYAAERSANEGPALLVAKRLYVWKTNLEDAMSDAEKFLGHLSAVSDLQNNFGFKVIDDGDEITSFDTALADVDEVIMTQYQLVAAVANVPATELLGTTPKGFQSTGEFESRNYHEELEAIQKNDLSPVLDRHYFMLALSNLDLDPASVRIAHNWAPVDSPTAKERAETNKARMETDTGYVNAGVLDPYEVRGRLRSDRESGYTGLAEDPVMDTPPEEGDDVKTPPPEPEPDDQPE